VGASLDSGSPQFSPAKGGGAPWLSLCRCEPQPSASNYIFKAISAGPKVA